MRRYIHEVVVTTSPEKLFRSITDIASWLKWDTELEATEHEGLWSRALASR